MHLARHGMASLPQPGWTQGTPHGTRLTLVRFAQVVDEIYDKEAAATIGITDRGQVGDRWGQ